MPHRILVVEDDDTVLAFAVAVLKSEGHDVKTATSVTDARKVLAAEKNLNDLCLVLDVVLEQENGIAFAQELLAKHATLRVLLISGFTDDVLMTDPETENRIAFLGKPFTKQDLVSALEQLCN